MEERTAVNDPDQPQPLPPGVRPFTTRAMLVTLLVLVTVVGGGGLAAAAGSQLFGAERPDGCEKPNRRMDLYAMELPKDAVTGQVRLGYGTTPGAASYPGPTIEMVEGQCLAITLHNRVSAETLAALRTNPTHPLGVSLHVHGVKYTQQSDGTTHSGSYVASGESRTYTWFAKKRDTKSAGTAGYWWYHDHVVGGEHGTQGIGSGLFGGVVVRRPGDPKPDRTFVTAFGDRQTINLRKSAAADTCDHANPQPGPTCFVAKLGERVEFINFGIGNDMHTWHLHGHAWANTRTGLVHGDGALADSTELVDNRTLGPGDSFGFQVVAGDSVGPGHWMLHCHMQFHSDGGMATMFHVLDAEGKMPPGGHHTPLATPSVSNHH
ncbi:multicopper oxidase domain-containing protein [Micromonospora sp. NPDC049679]|uniref:multicopper oxidase domain-containing protein n=1 Tax=Micromonospora sp. NPDC049679 TaxID=3155920 RepID=UPI0033FADA62